MCVDECDISTVVQLLICKPVFNSQFLFRQNFTGVHKYNVEQSLAYPCHDVSLVMRLVLISPSLEQSGFTMECSCKDIHKVLHHHEVINMYNPCNLQLARLI